LLDACDAAAEQPFSQGLASFCTTFYVVRL
jgi:hypothetical protein